LRDKFKTMAKCNFEWSMCTTCANAGSSLCPLENNRTIRELQDKIDDLENEIDDLEGRIDDLERK